MKWFPFEHIILSSPLSPEEVNERVIGGVNEVIYKENNRSRHQRFFEPLLEPSLTASELHSRYFIPFLFSLSDIVSFY